MKQIKIEVSFSERKKHSIHIDYCEWLHLENKAFADKFVTEYKKLINDNVKILNNTVGNIYLLYRNFYFEIDSPYIDNLIVSEFNDINKRFSLVFTQFSEGNGKFVFDSIERIFSQSIKICEILKAYAQKKKHYALNSQTSAYLKLLADMLNVYEVNKRDLKVSRTYEDIDKTIINYKFQ